MFNRVRDKSEWMRWTERRPKDETDGVGKRKEEGWLSSPN